jgi:hypothetical protein
MIIKDFFGKAEIRRGNYTGSPLSNTTNHIFNLLIFLFSLTENRKPKTENDINRQVFLRLGQQP